MTTFFKYWRDNCQNRWEQTYKDFCEGLGRVATLPIAALRSPLQDSNKTDNGLDIGARLLTVLMAPAIWTLTLTSLMFSLVIAALDCAFVLPVKTIIDTCKEASPNERPLSVIR